MSATTVLKSWLNFSKSQVIAYSIFGLSSITIASPSLAASVDFNTWTGSGDFVTAPNEATVTNAFLGGSDDGGSEYNISGTNLPTFIGDLESFLDLNPGDLGIDATEGSAIKTVFTGVKAGDVFSFDWLLTTFDTANTDRAFVSINNFVQTLNTSSPFSYTFANSGIYQIGIGIVDVNDSAGSSTLAVRDAKYQSVPEPTTILGSLVAVGWGVMYKRRQVKKG